MTQSARIFLSHSSKDNDFVRRLANDLKSKGVPVWFDEWELKVGDSLNERIGAGIKESAWLAVILSKNSVESAWVKKELNAALETELEKKQVFVLPIVIENCEIPVFLRDKMFADFRRSYEYGLSALLKRLIPEKAFFVPVATEPSIQVHRQPPRPRSEDFLINIVDARIEGRDDEHPGLLNVVFKLDKTPDDDWTELFEHPTSYILSIHAARVLGDEIYWPASESDIPNKKQWIYDWVTDANNRYLPVVQQRIAQKEALLRRSQQENEKIAKLENVLRGRTEGVLVKPTNAVMIGLCTLTLEGCTARSTPAPITQVNFDSERHIHLCFNCLQRQLDSGQYRLE
ncbi:MAG: toll/interleukin-1 receptor domain-containing protein [Bacteroidota bacterium]